MNQDIDEIRKLVEREAALEAAYKAAYAECVKAAEAAPNSPAHSAASKKLIAAETEHLVVEFELSDVRRVWFPRLLDRAAAMEEVVSAARKVGQFTPFELAETGFGLSAIDNLDAALAALDHAAGHQPTQEK